MDSVVIKRHVGRKRRKTGDPRGKITAAQDEARDLLLSERYLGSQRQTVPDYTDLVGQPGSWATQAALKRLASESALTRQETKELLSDPDEFFMREVFGGTDQGMPFYVALEQQIEGELAAHLHKAETFETKRMGIAKGLGDIYQGKQEFIRNPELEKRSTHIQSLSFDRKQFNKTQATRWAQQNGFSVPKLHLTPNLIKVRQHHPGEFKRGSFRTKELTKGVKAIIGVPK